jgi:hypothetical protein
MNATAALADRYGGALCGVHAARALRRAAVPGVAAILAVAASVAMAATYTVSPLGDDSGPGTEAAPWKTLRKAAAAVQPGDTVRIRAGEYFVGPTWRVSRAGEADRPITYRAHGDGEVRITGSTVLPASGWGKGGNRIFNNVFFGGGKRGGISLNSPDNLVAHNTFVDSTYGVGFHRGQAGNRVVNNVFQGAARAFLIWPEEALPQTLDHNLYHAASPRWQRDGASFDAFAEYQQAAGETHSLCADPLLRAPSAGDARPAPGSPAVDAGAALAEVPADFGGVLRPQGAACDLGAYEQRPVPQER